MGREREERISGLPVYPSDSGGGDVGFVPETAVLTSVVTIERHDFSFSFCFTARDFNLTPVIIN